MKNLTMLLLVLCAVSPRISTAEQMKGKPLMKHAKGSFEVKMAPQGEADAAAGSSLGRYLLEKKFDGGLNGSGKGEMLTAGTDKGSAAYVAIERVTGTLDGRKGSFALVHRGVMTSSSQTLSIEIVPDSGSGELTGISGRLNIDVSSGKHLYELEYNLPEP